MRASRLAGLLAALALAVLIVTMSIEYIFPSTVQGTLTYTRISGKPVTELTVHIPTSEEGKNIFKVFKLKATSAKGAWTVKPGPKGVDEYPDYWILSGPPLEPGESVKMSFEMDYTRDVDYEAYPWTVVADIETTAPVTVYENVFVSATASLLEWRQTITLILGVLAAASTLTAITFTFYEKPTPPVPEIPEALKDFAKPKKCPRWRYVCLRFFVVDRCGGSNEGLLKGVKYRKSAFGKLSDEAEKKILKLIEKASGLWEQCCIRLIPCRDDKGEPLFRALDPKRASYEEEKLSKAVKLGKYWTFLYAKATYMVDFCQLFKNRKLKTREMGKSINPIVKKRKSFVWREMNPKQFDGTPLEKFKSLFKEGMPVEKAFEEALKNIKKRGDRQVVENALKELQEELPKELKEEDVDVLKFLSEQVVDKHFGEKCVDVFVFGDYDDEAAGEEAGVALMPGRVIFLDEEVVTKDGEEGPITLAHEVGHNLSLGHVEDENNVMHPTCGGKKLNHETQCVKANRHLEKEERKLCDERAKRMFLEEKIREWRKALGEAEAYFKKVEKLHKKNEKKLERLEGKREKAEKNVKKYERYAEKEKSSRMREYYRKKANKYRLEAERYEREAEPLKKVGKALEEARDLVKGVKEGLGELEKELQKLKSEK